MNACSKPSRMPPMPANKSIDLYIFSLFSSTKHLRYSHPLQRYESEKQKHFKKNFLASRQTLLICKDIVTRKQLFVKSALLSLFISI